MMDMKIIELKSTFDYIIHHGKTGVNELGNGVYAESMSLYTYLGNPNTNLVCCICHAPFTDPTTTRTCTHTFCHECIHRALTHASQCPVDRLPLTPGDLGPADPIIRSLVDELEVECVHRAEGCVYTCQRQRLAGHLREDCEYAVVECPEGCGEVVKRGELCEHLRVHGGGDCTPQEESETTETTETSRTATPRATECCETCPYSALHVSDPRVAQLVEQNVLLRARVEALEGVMGGLRREAGVVKDVLGPWYGAGAVGGSGLNRDGYGRLNVEERGEGYEVGAGGTSPGVVGPEAMRFYFPAVDVPANSGAVYSGMVAPLNLGTTLEGTLTGLRESVVGVAAGVDAVGRRSEIALTNETLRLGDEVMSLRAGLHGLRMQVHAMMMDRNAVVTGRTEEGGGWGIRFPPVGSTTKL